MVLGMAWLIVGSLVYANQGEPPAFTAPEVAAASEAPEPARVVVIGDSYTDGSAEGGNGPAGWPTLIQQRFPDASVQAFAAGGAGYVAASPVTGQSFVNLAAEHAEPDADVFVIFGSRNDGGDPDAVGAAATEVLTGLRSAAPDAALLVIGPPWVSADVPGGVERNRDAIQAAAAAVGATFVDPLAEGWFFDDPSLIGGDGVHPTDAGHVYMADRIEPALRALLAT